MGDIRTPIAQLSSECINTILAFNVIDSLSTLIKLLLENSTEADASRIDLKVIQRSRPEGQALDITFQDDGHGIAQPDREEVARLFQTSLQEKDTTRRGLTLGSLAYVSENLQISTKTEGEEQGQVWTVCLEANDYRQWPLNDQHGTRVEVKGLFSRYGSRLVEEQQQFNTSLQRMKSLLSVWAVLHPEIQTGFYAEAHEIFRYAPAPSADPATAAKQIFTSARADFTHLTHNGGNGYHISAIFPTFAGT